MIEMATRAPTKLDAHVLRRDFPIFEQEINGKPLAYLDSANTSQKPRQVLDGMTVLFTPLAKVRHAASADGAARSMQAKAATVTATRPMA